MAQLDPLDRKLLRVLQERGDLSQAALAEAIGSSPASCWRRVKALESAGILGPTVRLLNRKALGKNLDAICHVRLKSQDRASRASFEALIQDQDMILECLSTSGEWDYQLRIICESMDEYEQFMMNKLLNNDAVANSSSQFVLKRIKHTTALPV